MSDDTQNSEKPSTGYNPHAAAWFHAGFQPLPVIGKAISLPEGFTGYRGRLLTYTDVVGWMFDRPDDNIALRANGWVGIDVDHYQKKLETKTGGITLALAEAAWGPLPPTWRITARTDDPISGIRLYAVPQGDPHLATQIVLPDPETGEKCADIEVIQWSHRYAITWPSIHPDLGTPYRLYRPDGTLVENGEVPYLADLPPLPAAWIENLRREAQDPTLARDAVEVAPQRAEMAAWGERVMKAYADGLIALGGAAGSRHDSMGLVIGRLARYEERGQAGATSAIEDLRDRFVVAVQRAGAEGEFDRMVEFSRRQAASTQSLREAELRRWDELLANAHRGPGIETPTGPTVIPDATLAPRLGLAPDGTAIRPPYLPEEFWTAREGLEHIRQAARARMVGPDAAFGCVLAFVAGLMPPSFRLPDLVGAVASTNFYVGLTGASGASKSTPMRMVRRDLIDARTRANLYTNGLGSGEGLIEAYLGMVNEEDDDGKKRAVKAQIRANVVLSLDEGSALSVLGKRDKSTTMPYLRSMWNGDEVGTANAGEETKRRLADGSYSLGFVMGVQPAVAAVLFDDVGLGTPQRFLWVATEDLGIPDTPPPWPGPLRWDTPSLSTERGHRSTFGLPPEVVAEIQAHQRDKMANRIEIHPLDSHAMLLREKVAALLAVLDGRLDISMEDWALASIVLETSIAVRTRLLDELAGQAEVAEAAYRQKRVRDATAITVASTEAQAEVEAKLRAQALDLAVNEVVAKALKADKPMTRTQVAEAISGRHRQTLGGGRGQAVAEVLAACLDRGFLVEVGFEEKTHYVARTFDQ